MAHSSYSACARARKHTLPTFLSDTCVALFSLVYYCSSVVGVMQVRGAYEIALPAGDADVVATIDYTL